MKITSMQKLIAFVVVILIAAAAAVVLVVLPRFGELDTLALQKTSAEQQLQQAKGILAQLEEAKSRSAVTEADMLKIGTQMPDSPQLPTLIIELQDIANDSGVSVTSFSPGQPTPNSNGKYTEIAMTTQLTTEWDDLLYYLRRLSASTRLLRVTNVTINPAASTETTAPASAATELAVSLTTKAFVIGSNGQIAASGAGTATPTPAP